MALYKWIRWLYFHGLGGSATMEYSFYLSDKAMQNFDSIRDMEDYVENRLDFLVDKIQMDTYLSQLIANVTGSFGNAPVVILSE